VQERPELLLAEAFVELLLELWLEEDRVTPLGGPQLICEALRAARKCLIPDDADETERERERERERQRGRERESEREREKRAVGTVWPGSQLSARSRNWACNMMVALTMRKAGADGP
jgi:hypothetical protein